jgi:hypothetical protein
MPPRWFAWLIGLFWLTMMGWLFWRDLWPSLRPGDPPPFHIDDVEEVLRKSGSQRTTWTVLRQVGHVEPTPAFNAVTGMEYKKDEEVYTLEAKLTPLSGRVSPATVINGLRIEKMISHYSIDRARRLRSLDAEVTVTLQPKRLTGVGAAFSSLYHLLQKNAGKGQENLSSTEKVTLRIWGEVRGNQFFGHCRADAGDPSESSSPSKPSSPIKLIELDLPPTSVSHTGSVLMPLHPVNQISGLFPDQRWHQPLIDPLRDALPGLSNSVRSLNAHVLPQPRMLKVNDGETSCLVIEYRNDENEILARTWVEQNSNRVLQQEAILDDSHWIMKRARVSAPTSVPANPSPARGKL